MSNDLDQGGTFREWVNTYLGPTVGWVRTQVNNINVLSVVNPGTTTIAPPTTLVQVNCAGLVTIQLPSASPLPPAFPLSFLGLPVTIVDVGGHAATFPITILPAVGETIMGLASLVIQNDFGSFTLVPSVSPLGWTQQ